MKLRKVYLINPKLQLSLIAMAALISVSGSVMLQFFFTQYFSDVTNSLQAAGIAGSHPLAQYMILQQEKMQKLLVAVGIISLVLNVIVLTWISHRIAGPLYRIHVSMENILQGTQTWPVAVRKNDFFKPTAALLEKIRQRGLKDPS